MNMVVRPGSVRTLLPIALLTLLLVGAACQGREEGAGAPKAQQGPAPAVVVAEVVRKTVPIYGNYVAQTEANTTVELRARVEGALEEVFFKEGSSVKRGDLLFQIDPREYQTRLESAKAQLQKDRAQLAFAREQVNTLKARAELVEAQAKLAKVRQDVERYRPLVAKRAIPQQDLDGALAAERVSEASVEAVKANLINTELTERASIEFAESAVKASQAGVTKAELDLSHTTIGSPIDGYIGRLAVNPGNLVGRGESTLLATVSSSDPIYANFSVSETDYVRLSKRVQAGGPRGAVKGVFELVLADSSIYPHKGDFGLVERSLDPRTGTLTIRAIFPNPDRLIRPGQYGRIRVAMEERPNALLIPQKAILEIQGTKMAYVVGPDNKVALRTLAVDQQVGEFLVVTDGVAAGERVIVEGIQKARPGMAVVPTAAAPSAPRPAQRGR
jgi:membrane fusion protein (multidrug efflux system)